jgi:cyclohexyl-isocyanide hydratase
LNDKAVQVGFVLFPDLTQLDFTGPLQVLHRLPRSRMHLVAATMDLVPSDCGLSLAPTTTFAECPPLDVICVPGGAGVAQAMLDPATLDFVRRQSATARHVTSVCTGAFILGAAGLLDGVRATTHWAYHALLAELGAIPTAGRVVNDGRVTTGGGVTAGIDFALSLVARMAGEAVARAIQLSIEYDPAPPFDAGHPDRAPDLVAGPVGAMFAKRIETVFSPALARAVAARRSGVAP